MKIGVLALQGAFAEHRKMVEQIQIDSFEIRQKDDFEKCPADGYIIPGGESTVMGKLLRELDLFDSFRTVISQDIPVFGTCAGLLLLARSIENDPSVYLGTMDIVARRNAYGRQLGSFSMEGMFASQKIPMVFIRAPYIQSWGKQVEILSQVDGKAVAARQRNMLVTAFHPELTNSPIVHQYFAEMIKRSNDTYE